MSSTNHQPTATRLDKFCLYTAAAFPCALITSNSALEAIIALVGISWLGGLIFQRRNPFPDLLKDPLVLPWLAWYGAVVLSLLINGPGSKGWGHDLILFRQLLFMTALLDISRRMPIARTLMIGLAAGLAWVAINLTLSYTIGHDLIGNSLLHYQKKKTSLIGPITGLTAYAGPLFCCFALLRKQLNTRLRILAMAVGLLSFFLLFYSGVRTTIIASFAGLAVGLLWQFGRRFSIKSLTITGIACVLLLGIAIQNIQIAQINKVVNLASMYDRVKVWQVSTAMWQDSPWFGIGVSSFRETYKEKAATFPQDDVIMPNGTIFSWHKNTTHAHNTILMLLVCTGIPGLLTFLWLFGRLAINSIRVQNQHPEVIALLTVFILIALVGYNIYHSWYNALFAYLAALAGTLFGPAGGSGDLEKLSHD
ncbi:MAG: O-antigen ligase family protein [Proteobacteria bacterium]|nr:O-antigen ligase family protein [Pseudomonadota bacterium]MBU1714466.1 O-antigen ligase family protein [Pseudomonadota bacterium]